jgi:hypothetical protein
MVKEISQEKEANEKKNVQFFQEVNTTYTSYFSHKEIKDYANVFRSWFLGTLGFCEMLVKAWAFYTAKRT